MALGGGRSNYLTSCGFPCYCKACKSLFKANMYDPDVSCPNCDTSSVVPYDDLSLALTGGVVDEIFSWNTSDRLGRDLQLHDGVYFCPSCDHFSLRFAFAALYG
jgi:Zn finger protein HypA/HybF involved in hydrogenase expression